MGVTEDEFYDEARVAIVPMGFCFPGQDAKGGDLPPRRECAALWHEKIFAALPQILVTCFVAALVVFRSEGKQEWKGIQQDSTKE